MWRKRSIFILCTFIVCLLLLLGRLIQIQLVQTEKFSKHNINLIESSVKQRSQEVVIHDGRGDFLDRNGHSLTYEKKSVLVLFPFLKKMHWDVTKVAKIIDVDEHVLMEAIADKTTPMIFGENEPIILSAKQMEQINELKIPGVFAIDRHEAFSERPAEQLIGIIGENAELLRKRYPDRSLSEQTPIGITGLQASFDPFLLSEGEEKLVYHVDAIGAPLFGIDVKYVAPANPFYPVNIKTTLDLQLQLLAERLVDAHHIQKGGLVLLDIETNSILALVSRPTINRSNPYEGLGVHHLMFQNQIVGSVFKTVIAAAAIDHGLTKKQRMFDCSRKINGEYDEKNNYGMLSFTDSFARSCNFTFGQLGKELKAVDGNIIEQYAKKLSLLNRVGWEGGVFHFNSFHQLYREEKGRVFLKDDEKKDDNLVALSSIGQHEVRLTPIAVANMMSTIARGGKKEMVRAVSAIEYKDGSVMARFPKKRMDGESIAPYTAMELQRLLREVVINEHGTGRILRDLPYEVAGKSGTAQTGLFVGERERYNKWFAGFFPFKDPKYVLVTVNLDVPSDGSGVTQLFADVVKEIYAFDRQNKLLIE